MTPSRTQARSLKVRPRPYVVAAVLCALVLAGCVGRPPAQGEAAFEFPAGTHPWPSADGSEWPSGLSGPFALDVLENVQVPSFDGILLDMWLLRPNVPEGVRVPTVLWSAPYFGLNNQAGNDPAGWDNSNSAEAVPVNLLVANGYAVAILNLRGSGNSQGCYQLFGSIDWKDNAAAVEWLAAQPWSNGRIGMMGLSYHGTTPWMAAVEQPPALKTIVVAGMLHSLYTFFHTPQGAPLTIGPAFSTAINAIDMAPPLLGSPQEIAQWPGGAATKVPCPELVGIMTETYKSAYTDLRDEAFWEDRAMFSHLHKAQAAVFLTHGLLDYHGSGHAYQEDYVWANLDPATPKRMLVGQWGHEFPNYASAYVESGRDWNATALAWLEFWLKGLGTPQGIGAVEFQDSDERWHEDVAWPPSASARVALGLGSGRLAAAPAPAAPTFWPRPVTEFAEAACLPQPGLPNGLLYMTDELPSEVVLAGNPYALLQVSSDLPGGQVAAALMAVEQGEPCPGLGEGGGGLRFLGVGAADLRHHQGNYAGQAFPMGQPTPVRIDINNVAEVLAPGERLALLLAYGDATLDSPNPYSPRLTVHEAGSELVVPLLRGELDARAPGPAPPRPFDPVGDDP